MDDYPGIMTVSNIICIKPGESYNGSILHVKGLLDMIKDKVSLHDKVYIFVDLCNGKRRIWETKEDYASFVYEYEKMIKRAQASKESN